MSAKIDRYFLALCAVVLACLAAFAYATHRHLEIEYLLASHSDELPQVFQFQRMYEGLLDFDIKKFLFSFEFYNYGFCWYLLNFLVTAPFFALQNYEAAIYAPRILMAILSLVNVFLLYKIIKFYAKPFIAFMCALLFVSMFGFWIFGANVKPDMFQASFILASAYFLCKDEMKFGKNYIFSILFLGLGVGLAKFQAIMFMPMIYIYICLPLLSHFTKGDFIVAIKRMFLSLMSVLGLWIITNPYLVLFGGEGFKAWLGQFKFNMWSNATNHGHFVDVSLLDKLKLVDSFYFEGIVFAVLLIVCVCIIVKFLRDKTNPNLSALVSVVGSFLVSLGYLFFLTNKAWGSYYISTILLGVMVLGLGLNEVFKKRFFIVKILLLVLLGLNVANAYLTGKYQSVFDDKARDERVNELKAKSPAMVKALKEVAPQGVRYTILSNKGFSYRKLGIDPKDVSITYDGVYLIRDFIVLYKSGRLFDKALIESAKNSGTMSEYWALDLKTLQALENNQTNYTKVFDSSEVVIFKSLDFEKKLKDGKDD